jgi:hypothetical protein
MTRIIQGTGVGITHGAGDGLSEFPSDLADVGIAGSTVAFSVQASDTSALVTLASCIRGSDGSALPMRVLVAGPAAAVADSMIKSATFRGDRDGSLGDRPHLVGPRWVSAPISRMGSLSTGRLARRRWSAAGPFSTAVCFSAESCFLQRGVCELSVPCGASNFSV